MLSHLFKLMKELIWGWLVNHRVILDFGRLSRRTDTKDFLGVGSAVRNIHLSILLVESMCFTLHVH